MEKTPLMDLAWHRNVEEMVAPEWSSPEDDEAFVDLQSFSNPAEDTYDSTIA